MGDHQPRQFTEFEITQEALIALTQGKTVDFIDSLGNQVTIRSPFKGRFMTEEEIYEMLRKSVIVTLNKIQSISIQNEGEEQHGS